MVPAVQMELELLPTNIVDSDAEKCRPDLDIEVTGDSEFASSSSSSTVYVGEPGSENSLLNSKGPCHDADFHRLANCPNVLIVTGFFASSLNENSF